MCLQAAQTVMTIRIITINLFIIITKKKHMKHYFSLIFIFTLILGMASTGTKAQETERQYKINCIAFYNLENLFDTIPNNSRGRDEEYTPEGKKVWGSKIYTEKLENMADVISKIGTEHSPKGPAILGVCEVENRSVLEDLVKMPKIADRNYKIVHFDSPDYRGIDVGLLYQGGIFELTSSRSVTLNFPDAPKYKTRDQLVVSGKLDGEMIHIIVNHWPSRSGGEKRSRPRRVSAGKLCRTIVDSIMTVDPKAKIIVMGDLNDDPSNKSVTKALKAKGKKKKLKEGDLFNTTWSLHKKGIGTLAYRDSWNLFDQLIISQQLLNDEEGYKFYKTQIYNKKEICQKEGKYKGYPLRTHVGSTYMGGYSDHFPSYLFVIKEIKE